MDHATTLRRIYDLINAHDIEALGAHLAEDFTEHEELPGGSPTREGVLEFFRMQIAAFPDMAMTVEDIVDGGDRVVARVRLTGTQRGPFAGMPPTDRSIDVQVIDIMRFGDDGLVHEHWGVVDTLAMMEQLGAVSA